MECSAGDVADNFYYLYPEDIALMQSSGIRNFRFSISWPRIYPYGAGQVRTPSGPVAPAQSHASVITNLCSHYPALLEARNA